jgi:predicted secreted protein
MSLSTTKEGLEASQVQEQLKKAVDEALKQLRANASSNTYLVQTGSFSLNPRYSNQGKINGWQGSAELSVEGKDFGAIAQAAGAVKSMVVNSTTFSLSEEKRLEANAKAQSIAIERFKVKSQSVAKSFGYAAYNLKNVMISEGGSDNEPIYSARSKNIAFAMADSAPVPVQAGSSDVVVRVNGSIILKK